MIQILCLFYFVQSQIDCTYEPVELVCCIDDCSTCIGQYPCSVCISHSQMDNGLCICNDGYYQSILLLQSTCIKCIPECKTCSSTQVCISCIDSLAELIDGKCFCTSGYYALITASDFKCLKCLPECETCENSSTCLKCKDLNAIVTAGRCLCREGYFGVIMQTEFEECLKCEDSCSSCLGYGQCTNCVSLNTEISNGVCICKAGFWAISELNVLNACKICQSPCKTCRNLEYCYTCDKNYQAINGTCSCADGFYQEGEFCKKCSSSCKTCQNSTFCLSCSGENSRNINGICECADGFYQNNYLSLETLQCDPCASQCKKCASLSECQECNDTNKKLNDENRCVCIDRYFMDENENCLICNETCATCKSKDQCLTCANDTLELIDNQKCLKKCPDKMTRKNDKCSCRQGFKEINSSCVDYFFHLTLKSSKSNKLALLFNEPLKSSLNADRISINLGKGISQEFKLFSRSPNEILLILQLNHSVNNGTKIQLKLKRPIFSKYNALLEKYEFSASLYEYEYIDHNTKALIEKSAGAIKIMATTSIGFLIISNPAATWALIGALQLLPYIPLSTNYKDIVTRKFFTSIGAFNLLPNFFIEIFHEDSAKKPDKEFQALGIKTSVFFINTGKIFLPLIALIILYPFIIVLSKFELGILTLKLKRLLENYRYGVFIRFFIQGYIDLGVFSIIALKAVIFIQSLNHSNGEFYFNQLTAGLTIFLVLIAPFFSAIVLFCIYDDISEESFVLRYGTFFLEFKNNKGILTSSQTITQIPAQGYPTQYPRYSSLLFSSNKLYTFGGSDNKELSNDLKYFDLSTSTWNEIFPHNAAIPEPRLNSLSFVYNQNLFIFGGQTSSKMLNDLWEFDITNQKWVQIQTSGQEPRPRVRSSLTHSNDSVFLYGGQSQVGYESAVYQLDLNTFIWSLVVPPGVLEARAGSALVVYNESLFIWGGSTFNLNFIKIDSSGNISEIKVSGDFPDYRQSFPYSVYDDFALILPGYSHPIGTFIKKCFKISMINLESSEVNCGVESIYSSFTQVQDTLYVFGGENFNSYSNELGKIDLSKDPPVHSLISPDIVYPKPRSGHTMMKSRSYLWVFGGCSSGAYYSDSWKFNLRTETWELIPSNGVSPSARCGHKVVTLLGDTFLLFGGRNNDDYLNDIFMYNFLSNEWTDLTGEGRIPARSGACLVFYYPELIIQGGINSKGVLSDLWVFNIMTSAYSMKTVRGEAPNLYNHNCKIIYELFGIAIYSGTNLNGKANPSIYFISFIEYEWMILYSSDSIAISNTQLIDMVNFNVIIGGSKYIEAQKDIIFLYGIKPIIVGSLPKTVVSHQMTHAGKSIYIYGGEYTADKVIFKDKGSPLLLRVTMENFTCSDGFYGDLCDMCPPGTYNSASDSNICQPCWPGTSSDDYALNNYAQCLPCEYGSYTEDFGSKVCFDCANPSDCKFKTVVPKSREYIASFISSQPTPFNDKVSDSDEYIRIVQLSVGSLIALLFLVYLLRNKLKLFNILDFFKERHKRKYYEEPFSTPHGGLFTLSLILLILMFIVTPLVSYFISNISEMKTLVPSFTLENSIFESDYAKFEFTFYDYAGLCVFNGTECDKGIETYVHGVDADLVEGPYCEIIDINICRITFFGNKISFEKSSSINLTIIDSSIFATGLEVKAVFSTSIPGDYNESSVKFFIESEKNQVFNGPIPTIFYLKLIPTLFLSDSSEWKNNVTGYHVTSSKNPTYGSISDSKKIGSYNFLKVALIFERSENAFVVDRFLSVKIMTLISGILGSIAGLFGVTGWMMITTENFTGKVKETIKKKKRLKDIVKKMEEIKEDQINLFEEKYCKTTENLKTFIIEI